MIRDVVGWWGRENQCGCDPSHGLGDAASRLIVVKDREVAEFETDIIGTDQLGRLPRFLTTDGRDRLGIVFGTPAVSRRHGGDRHRDTGVPQQDQSTSTLKFHIVRMSMQGEHAYRFGHD